MDDHVIRVVRDDVRIRRAGERLYVCRADGPPLRLRATAPGPDGPVDLVDLPSAVAEWLARRGLLVPAGDPVLRHPSYPAAPPIGAGVRVVGEDALSVEVARRITAAGVSSQGIRGVGALVVGLAAPDGILIDAVAEAIGEGIPIVAHLTAGARVYWAVLWPPATACPLCVSVRIRAGQPDRALGAQGLDVVLGACADERWPSNSAAAGLLAHQSLRLVTGAADPTPGTGAGVDTVPAELIELDLDLATTTRHPLLHTPFCPACGHAARWPSTPPPTSTAASWDRMHRAVDPLTGIVAGLVVNSPGDPRTGVDCTVAWARGGTDTTWFSSVRASTVGGATKRDPTEARVCALGEVLERYAAGVHRAEDLIRASLTELGEAAVDPRSLPLGSAGEYAALDGELVPYRPNLEIDWVEGRSLVTGQARYLPAAAVYVPYRAPHRSERLLHPNSTGLAAGADPAHATVGGLCEVIERDAAAVYWYNWLAAPTLDLAGLPEGPARAVLERIRARGVDLLAKDITTDLGIPAVLVRARFGRGGQPVALCGFRAGLSLSDGLLGAGQELEHLLAMYHRSREQGRTTDPSAEPQDIWDFATYYCHESRIGAMDFMADGPTHPVPGAMDPAPTERPDHARAVERLVARLNEAGHDVVTVELTPIDVAECGVSVVRTVVPGLQPVSFHRRFRHLGGRRVYAAPVRMGLRTRELTEGELNPGPIPLG